MKIEAVIVCINYSDFLKVTLPTNRFAFDKMVVVTDTQDTETHKVCEFYNVECVKTDIFYRDGKVPNKALGINEGLKKLAMDGWVVQLDADIWLPPLTRNILEKLPLETDKIYGMDRLMCNSFNEWFNFINLRGDNVQPMHEGWIYLHLHSFPVGQRIVQYHGEGYMPIGYFQIWHPGGSGVRTYPVEIAGYDRTDVCHLKQFPREKRGFIPELACIHLASEEHVQGQNWQGRTSRDFLPPVDFGTPPQLTVQTTMDVTEPRSESLAPPRVTLWDTIKMFFQNLFKRKPRNTY